MGCFHFLVYIADPFYRCLRHSHAIGAEFCGRTGLEPGLDFVAFFEFLHLAVLCCVVHVRFTDDDGRGSGVAAAGIRMLYVM